MKYLLSILFAGSLSTGFAQSDNAPAGIAPEAASKMAKEISRESELLREKLKKNKYSDYNIEFTIDTFRIERQFGRYVDMDYSTAGMTSAAYEAAAQYDSLMNKYYRRLYQLLSVDDRKVLVKAQKAWLAFRDSETELTGILGKEEYSGGGTMQLITDASAYLELIRKRTIELFEHLSRATQSY